MTHPHPRQRDRRDFIKSTVAASAAMALGGAASSPVPAAEGTEPGNTMVQVHHEWGTLKEVVCGIPYFKIPTSLPKAVYNYAPTEGIKFFEANLGKTFEQASPTLYQKASVQMEAAVSILKERGIKVPRPEPCNQEELGYLKEIFPESVIQFYPRDPMIVIGNRFIETGLFFPMRRRERFGIRRALSDR